MRISLFLTLFICMAVGLKAQQIDSLILYIYDESSGSPVIGAAVGECAADGTLIEGGSSGMTDFDGLVVLRKINGNSYLRVENIYNHPKTLRVYTAMDDGGQIGLLARAIELDGFEIVVTGSSGYKEKLKEVPSKVNIIRDEDIALYNPQNSAEALLNTGDIFIQKSQMGGGSPIIRGFEANKVLIVLDGVRMNNAIYRSGHLQNVISVDKDVLKRVEVHHGPASVMYGSDALGGVMHFYTKDPLLRAEEDKKAYDVNAYMRAATANFERTGHLDFNVGNENFASLTSLTFSAFGNLRAGRIKTDTNMARYWNRYFYSQYNTTDSTDEIKLNENPNVQIGTGYSQLDFLQKLRFRPLDNMDVLFNLQYSTTTAVPRYDQLTEGEATFDQGRIITQDFKYSEWFYGPQGRLLASLTARITEDSSPVFNNANIVAAFQKIDEDRITRRFGDDLRRVQEEDVYVFNLNADFVKAFNNARETKLLYGLEAAHNIVRSDVQTINIRTDSTSSKAIGTRYPDGGSTMTTAAAYTSYRIKFNDRANIIAGARYTFAYLNAKFVDTVLYDLPFSRITASTHSLTGSIALAWDMGSKWQLNMGVSSAFRPPNIDDFGKIRAKGMTVSVPNEDLKAEKAINTELSLGKQFGQKVRFSSTFFYTYLFDAIVQQPFSLNNSDSLYYDGEFRAVRANVNAGRAFIWGLSGNMAIEFSESTFMKATVNYTHGRRFVEGSGSKETAPLAHVPPFYGQVSLNYKRERFSLNFMVRFNGPKKLKNYDLEASSENWDKALTYDGYGELLTTPTPAWFTINIHVNYKISEMFSINLGVENLLDWHYRPYSSGVSASGQNIMVAIRGHF